MGVNHYGALQHADAMACDVLTCNGMCRGRKSFGEGCVNERYDGGVLLGDVCRDEMFGCCCECIGGVNQYGALHYADTMVYGTLTLNGMRRGQKSYD